MSHTSSPAARFWERQSYQELAAVLLQVLFVAFVFSKLLFHPGQYLIVDHYDGIKSYFSIESFLRQPLSEGMVVHGHNYPFGEYMYYTDSTPLVVQALHVLVRAFPALAPYGLYLYDVFILSGLVLGTWLVHRICRPLGLPGWLAVVLSVALPWLGPQTFRLQVGHMSLSYTPALLFTVWVLQQIYLAWTAQRPVRKWFVWLAVGIMVAAYLHFYYLGILGVLCGFFFLFWLIQEYRAGRPWLRLAQYAAVALLVPLVLTVSSLMLLDGRYQERPAGSGGYDWIEWKFQFGALFRGNDYNVIRFPLERTAHVPYESVAYLTSFVLFGLLVTAALAVLRQQYRVRLDSPSGRFVWLFFLASIPLLSIAAGETYMLDNDGYVFHNYTNPFFWLHKLTDRVTQFRALGRFIWPFWWAMLLGFSWYVAHWRHRPVLRWVLVLLVVMLAVDTRDAMRFYRSFTQKDNLLTATDATAQTRDFLSWLDTSKYQAVLPFPLYHVGAEGEFNYIVDPDDPHCNMTYQLALLTKLPTMAHKATRTVYRDAQLITTVVKPGGPEPELLAKLDSRPILVYIDSAYYNGQNNYYRDLLKDRPEMLALFERTDDFIREQRMTRVRHQGARSLYEWYPKAAKP